MLASPILLSLVMMIQPSLEQAETQLRSFFEGKSVHVKIEMPGSADGVDVYPGSERPVDFPRHAARLKRFGTAVRRGDEVLITKVKVKRDLIEVQLGGGGFGTFGDDSSASVSVPSADKTEREKNLEKDIDKATDPAERRKLREELDTLKRRRQREDARNQAEAAQAQPQPAANPFFVPQIA